MVHQVTEGVSITVETFYQPGQSNPLHSEYFFAYRITIENQSPMPVKLLRRHWHILESSGVSREVEGDGVIGQQPIIEPAEQYQYVSAVNIRTDIGKMYGTYEMENLYNNRLFKVQIPVFELVAPFKLN